MKIVVIIGLFDSSIITQKVWKGSNFALEAKHCAALKNGVWGIFLNHRRVQDFYRCEKTWETNCSVHLRIERLIFQLLE